MAEELLEKANKLPQLPGVYIMKDDRGEVIYVGKALSLKNRVSSYFRGDHLPKVAAMAAKVADFDVIVADSEFEALVLENSLIKRHRPHYNILLRDDKGYPFVRLDMAEDYPRFTLVRCVAKDGARYFGPFGGRGRTKEILDTIGKALGLPTCSRRFPRDRGKDRPCLNLHMGACRGWCLPEATREEYRAAISQAEMVLDGRKSELTVLLESQMLRAAEELRFEAAARLRDRLRAVSSLDNRQHVVAAVTADTDAVGFFRGARCCFSVLHYTGGDLAGKEYSLLEEPLEDDAEALSNLLRQYYAGRGAFPGVILLPIEPEDRESLERLFVEASGHRVRLEVPKRGDRLRLVEAASTNAREESLRATTAAQRRSKTLEWLQKALSLPEFPARIEAFDVSNTGDFGIVAAMTVFADAKPLKKDYRKFRIKDGTGQDDYGSMRQVLQRRFTRYLDGDERFDRLPSLLLIDGGQAHAQAAARVLAELKIDLPVFGMVKDDRHRTRALVTPEGREIGLAGNQAAFALVGSIQEETHRAAISYHRSLRSESFHSALDAVPGVGEKRRNELLRTFGSLKSVKNAAPEELERVVPKNAARAVWEYFHSGEEK
jgi:excinuclease ABC subunit C